MAFRLVELVVAEYDSRFDPREPPGGSAECGMRHRESMPLLSRRGARLGETTVDEIRNRGLHRETVLGKIESMSEPQQIPPAAIPTRAWNADLLFAVLGDPVRRRILLVLADGKGRTATELKGSAHRKLDATLKHLVALRAGGLVVTQENPVDGRRLLYLLAPGVQVRQTEAGGRELDFGPCVVRL